MKRIIPTRSGGWLLALGVGVLVMVASTAVFAEEGEPGRLIEPDPDATSEDDVGRMARLAPPPTVAAPTQADDGAQLYWLHCQPCHGDQGQGLTDDWRAQYPPEDQYCWESGCHGENPYDNGFTLPFTIPAVIGEGTLTKYQTVGGLYRYVHIAMPYWNPDSLTDEEYLAITAHLAQANGVWDGTVLTAGNVDGMIWPAGAVAAATEPNLADSANESETATASTQPLVQNSGNNRMLLWGGLAVGILILAGGIWLWQRLNH
ncbi:MAG: c-type cytochrome [Chloroflexota bacterium]